jgi:hypothetical protein
MSIRRITISVPAEVASRIRKAAGGSSVSAWITGVIEDRLDDAELERMWQEFCRSVRPRSRDVRRANSIFKRLVKAPRRKSAA